MPSRNEKRKHYFWLSLLFLTIAACTLLLHFSQVHKGKQTAIFSDLPAAQSERLIDDECPHTCITKECLYHANLLMTNMKPSVDPCDNFYSYACGNHDEKFGKDDVESLRTKHHRKMVTALKNVLDNIDADPGTASWKLKTVYESCMKFDSENEALPEALKFLNELGIGPDWPFLAPDFKFENTSIATILGNLLAYNECPLMSIYVKVRTSLNGKKNVTIEVNTDIVFHRHDPAVARKMFLSILKEFGLSSEESETTETLLTEVLRIHGSMNELNTMREQFEQDDANNSMNCSEENESEWEDLCEILEAFMNKTNLSKEFSQTHAYIPRYDIYFVKNIVRKLEQFKDRDVANYLAMHFFWTHGMDLSFPFRLSSWKKSLEETPFQPSKFSRWEYCVNWLADNMYIPLGYEFAKKVIPKEVFDEVAVAFYAYSREIMSLIDEQEWITQSLKKPLMAKIGNLTLERSMLRLMFNETVITEAYKEFNFSSENYFKNILQHQLFTIKKTGELFKDSSRHAYSPFQAQALYVGYGVDIMFGMLFPSAYSHNLERLINLITLGGLLAHEIGHGVFAGFYEFRDVANNQLFENFNERVLCVAKQYSELKFHSLDAKLRGIRYAVEGFSDMVAVAAIDKMIEKHVPCELSLLGAPFTTEQLLYISLAQNWCSKSSKEEDEYYRTVKIHPPSRFRAIVQMQGSKNFAKAFNCTVGSYMNPARKCLAFD